MFSLKNIWATCPYMLPVHVFDKVKKWGPEKKIAPQKHH